MTIRFPYVHCGNYYVQVVTILVMFTEGTQQLPTRHPDFVHNVMADLVGFLSQRWGTPSLLIASLREIRRSLELVDSSLALDTLVGQVGPCIDN